MKLSVSTAAPVLAPDTAQGDAGSAFECCS